MVTCPTHTGIKLLKNKQTQIKKKGGDNILCCILWWFLFNSQFIWSGKKGAFIPNIVLNIHELRWILAQEDMVDQNMREVSLSGLTLTTKIGGNYV